MILPLVMEQFLLMLVLVGAFGYVYCHPVHGCGRYRTGRTVL